MSGNLLRSATAVVAACIFAIAAVGLAPVIFLPVVKLASPAYLDTHARIVFAAAYVFGTVVVALLAGTAVGVLAPGRPTVHMLSAAAVLEVIGFALGGTRTLPHGWQLLGFALQIALACAVAALTWSRRHCGAPAAFSRAA